MDKNHILDEIRRTASENGGVALGTNKFLKETGIKKTDWYGRYWVKWSDALTEAGYAPNTLTEGYDEEFLINLLIVFVRELKRLPSSGEIMLKGRQDKTLPASTTFDNRLGRQEEKLIKLIEYCKNKDELSDVLEICLSLQPEKDAAIKPQREDDSFEVGYIYLIKSGKYYKIGRSNSIGRREYELSIQLPEKPKVVHTISTDDAAGIEAYWHRRFANKRKNGEWFELDASDVKAFKRRKFM